MMNSYNNTQKRTSMLFNLRLALHDHGNTPKMKPALFIFEAVTALFFKERNGK